MAIEPKNTREHIISLYGHMTGIKKDIAKNVNFSSRIAAGIINPLVFRRMTKSWRVDDFIPFLKSHYKELEELTKWLLKFTEEKPELRQCILNVK